METLSYQKEIVAIKEHHCNFCGEKIKQKEKYIKSTHKYEGTVYDWKTHVHCSNIALRLNMYEDCEEGVTEDHFQETIYYRYIDIMLNKFPKEEINKYSEVIEQMRHVVFRYKLLFVISHYAKIDKSIKVI